MLGEALSLDPVPFQKNFTEKRNTLNSDIPFSNVVISAKGLGLLNPMLFTAKTRNW